MTDIKTLFEPIGDWSKIEDHVSGGNGHLSYTEYMFVPKDERMEILTYYKGGVHDGTLTVEPHVGTFLDNEVNNWKGDLSEHFTGLTGLPVKQVTIWG
jgi:hypothetical protein